MRKVSKLLLPRSILSITGDLNLNSNSAFSIYRSECQINIGYAGNSACYHLRTDAYHLLVDAGSATEGGIEWTLYRPEDSENVLEFITASYEFEEQDLSLTNDQIAQLRGKNIHPIQFIQKASDLVIIPAGYVCRARNLSSCIAISSYFISPTHLAESMSLERNDALCAVETKCALFYYLFRS